MTAFRRLFRRHRGWHRPGAPTRPFAPVDPWALGEAYDSLTDTVVLPTRGGAW